MSIARYTIMDPAGGRNYFIGWFATSPRQDLLYREWPGNYEEPGHGVPGPWAVESGKKGGCNDGSPGEGQDDFGFNLLRYKFVFARLEGWEDWRAWQDMARQNPDRYFQGGYLYPTTEQLTAWDERNGAVETIERRLMDCRSAALGTQEADCVSTLLTRFADIGMYWERASGAANDEGIEAINSALFYTETETGSGKVLEPPTLVIGKDCHNVIWALQNFTGEDKRAGACKDPIDLIRWFYGAGLSRMGGVRGLGIRNRDRYPNEGTVQSLSEREAMVARIHQHGPDQASERSRERW